MGTIVVGYVPKPEGRAAVERAVEEARLRDGALVVVNSHPAVSDLGPERAEELTRSLDEIRLHLSGSEVEHEVRDMVRGMDAAEDLIGVSEEVGAELLVIGLRRRTPVGKLILGSNAQRILLDAPCPVLAVKASE